MASQAQSQLENQIKACIAGDSEAFHYIFDYVKDRLFAYILSRAGNREDALDLTQEVFVDLWRALARFQYLSLGQFYAFIFLIARRRLIKFYRSRRIQVELNENNLAEPKVESNFDDHRDLLAGLRSLSRKYQEVLRLRYWSGFSHQEIGKILGAREATIKVWHYRAIQKLKKILKQL